MIVFKQMAYFVALSTPALTHIMPDLGTIPLALLAVALLLALLVVLVLRHRRIVTIEKVALIAAEHQQRLLAETLTDVTLALTARTDPDEVLNEILRQVQRLVPYRTAHIVLLKDGNLKIAYWHGYHKFGSQRLMAQLEQPLSDFPFDAEVVRSREPLLIPDTSREPRWVVQPETAWVKAHIVLPIALGAQVLGLLRLDADRVDAFSPTDLSRLQPLGGAAAIALENARLHRLAADEITERKRAEADLKASLAELKDSYRQTKLYTEQLRQNNTELARLNTAIEQSAGSIVITGADWSIEYVNPAYQSLTGLDRGQLLDANFLDSLFGSPDISVTRRTLIERLAEGNIWHGQLSGQDKTERPFIVDGVIAPIRDEDDTIVNFIASLRNVTREVKLEEQYLQAQKMEAIGRFTSSIAHDFNNLLTVINGFATTLAQQVDGAQPDLALPVAQIQEAGRRAVGLVEQLMSFSRKEKIRTEVVDVNQTILGLNRILRQILGRNIELRPQLAADAWLIQANPSQLEQIIVNLTVNAHDAMPNGGRVTIQTANMTIDDTDLFPKVNGQADYLVLTITDTGEGMLEEVRSVIFEPFFTTKGAGKGTGLGLSTVYTIVERYHGHITVDSQVGEGTTFAIYLPRTNDPLPQPSILPQSEATHNRSSEKVLDQLAGGDEVVLVVEDEPGIQVLTQKLLTRNGYRVLVAEDGEAALELVKQGETAIDLLLTDVVMTGMNGEQLIDQLKAHTNTPFKVMLMSGERWRVLVRQKQIHNADLPFLQKPFSAVELLELVRTVLDDGEKTG